MATDLLVASSLADFKAQRYSEALAGFSRAIESESNSAKLYDCRAACYEKLGRSRSALEDAKRVIQLRPDLAKGYLRAAKIYEAIGKLDTALKIAWAGKRSVKTPNSILDDQVEQLERQIKKRTASHFGLLPREVFTQAVSLLEERDRYQCTRVCRNWRSAIESNPILWDRLHLSGRPDYAAAKLQHWRLRLASESGFHSLSTLSIDIEFHRIRVSQLGRILSHLDAITTRLTFLTFRQSSGLQDLARDMPASAWLDPLLRFIFSRRITLQHLELHLRDGITVPITLGAFLSGFPRLNILITKSIGDISFSSLNIVAPEDLPTVMLDAAHDIADPPTELQRQSIRSISLRELECDMVAFKPPGTNPEALMQAHMSGLRVWDYLWPCLERISFKSIGFPAASPDDVARQLAPVPRKMTELREIDLRAQMRSSWSLLTNIIAPSLRRASLRGFDAPVTQLLCDHLHRYSPLLEVLDLSGCALRNEGQMLVNVQWDTLLWLDLSNSNVDDNAISRLPVIMPNLERLFVNGCAALTSVPLMRFVEARRSAIKTLCLDACILVKPEAINWMRAVVPSFSAKMGDFSKKTTWRDKFT